MPLKISDTGKAGLSSLNKWADEQERQTTQNTKFIRQHSASIQALTTDTTTPTPTPTVTSTTTQADVTSSRSFGGGPYANSGTTTLGVTFTISSSGGLGGTATIAITGGAFSTYGVCSANAVGGVDSSTMFTFFVLPGQSYSVTRDVHIVIVKVIETQF